MTLHFSWITSPQSRKGSWWITTISCVLVVDILFMWTLISCVIHIIFRNGVNTELAKEEFISLKLLIARMFWELMLSREPYCSEYKVSFCWCSFLRLCEFCCVTHCLNKSLEFIFLSDPASCKHYAGPTCLSFGMWKRVLCTEELNQTQEHPFIQRQWMTW